MNIKILKLKNSEEVLTEITKEEKKNITISTPTRLIPIQTEGGGSGMALVPWIMGSADKEYVLDREKDIMLICNPIPEIAEEYNRRYGSGLVIPSENVLQY